MGSSGPGGKQDPPKTITQVLDEGLGMQETSDYFTLKATVAYIKQGVVSYPSCLSENCNKKVFLLDHDWRCERCEKNWDRPKHRYILSINVSDHTGQIYLNCFDEVGKLVMGMSADELVEIQENDDQTGQKDAGEVFQEAISKMWTFRVRAKQDHFQDQQR
jgi:replication factor A1